MNSHRGSNVFLSTIGSVCETIRGAQPAPVDTFEEPSHEQLRGFVLSWVDAMPRELSLGVKALTLLLGVSGLLYGGRLFHRNPARARQAQWRRWRVHRVSYLRDYVRFFEVLTTFAIYSATEPAPRCEAGAVELASLECG
jgi:hypothetical protein